MKSDNQDCTEPLFFEVFNYFIANELDIVKVQSFYNFYSLNGWTNKNKESISDWKLLVEDYFNNEKND